MDQDFIADIEALRNAQTELAKLAASAKPWADYCNKMVEFIVAKHFREYPNGKHPVALPTGEVVEFEKGENVAVREELLETAFNTIVEARKQYPGSELEANLGPMAPAELAALNALHKLVVWKPSLSQRDYNKLPKWAQELFDRALQRSPSKPKITIKDARS